jgi:hypothetical protein
VTQVLALACASNNDLDLCQRISRYRKGSSLSALQDILQLQSRAEGRAGRVDVVSQIMGLRIMLYLVEASVEEGAESGCLSYAQLVSCGQASIFCLSELGSVDKDAEDSEAEVRAISCCCLVLASLTTVRHSQTLSQKQLSTLNYTVVNGITSKPAMKALSRLLTFTGSKSQSEDFTSSVQGCCGEVGALDGLLALLSASATAQQSAPSNSKSQVLFSMGAMVAQQLQTAGSGEISPGGTLHALRFIATILSTPSSSPPGSSNQNRDRDREKAKETTVDSHAHMMSVLAFANQEGIAGLLALVCLPQHLDLCLEWSKKHNDRGNSEMSMTDGLLESAGDILRSLMTAISSPPVTPADTSSPSPVTALAAAAAQDSQKILEGVYRSQLIKCLLQALSSKRHLSGRVVASVVHVLSELVLTSSKFMAQFVECGGLEVVVEAGTTVSLAAIESLRRDGADGRERDREKEGVAEEQIVVCMLQISSHLARHSEKHFQVLQHIFIPSRIVQLLSQVEPISPHNYFDSLSVDFSLVIPHH